MDTSLIFAFSRTVIPVWISSLFQSIVSQVMKKHLLATVLHVELVITEMLI